MTWIVKGRAIVVAGAFLSLMAGCGTATFDYSKGDFSGVVQKHEANSENDSFEKLGMSEQIMVCKSYYEVKNYTKFDQCYNSSLRFLDSSNIPVIERMVGASSHNKTDLFRLTLIHYDSLIDRGQYQRVLVETENNIAKWEADNGFLSDSSFYLPKYYGTAGHVNALLGNNERALECIEKMGGHAWRGNNGMAKKQQKVKIYLAMGDYRGACALWSGKDNNATSNGLFNVVSGAVGIASLAAGNVQGLTFLLTPISAEMNKLPEIRQLFTGAKVYYEIGEYEKSQKEYQTLLSNPYFKNFGSLYYIALHDMGRMKLQQGDSNTAIQLFKEAVEIIESQRATINTEASKIGFVGDKQHAYQSLISALFDQGRYEEAFTYVERGKARALVDLLAGKDEFKQEDGSENVQINALLSDIEREELLSAAAPYQNNKGYNNLRSTNINKLSNKLAETFPELSSLVTVSVPTLTKIQQFIAADETLIEYFYDDHEQLYAFIINRNKIEGVKLDGGGLAESVSAFRKDVQNYQADTHKTSGFDLYKRLIQPIDDKIESRKITIVPHGVLHYLPFNALYRGHDFLIDHYTVRVLPSASVMQFLDKETEGAASLLALGNPDLGNPDYDLPFAQDEAINVASKIKNSKVLLRKNATESAVKKDGAHFKYLHFASHGNFDAVDPLSSGLLLAKDEKNDGTLTVGELYDLHLNADLVTLSACETALGQIANGDDVVGFTRGFLYAGASSIVSSLWQVDDQATSRMMDSFYTNLQNNDKQNSLRLAQLKIKKEYNPHPFFWAAFQLTGSN